MSTVVETTVTAVEPTQSPTAKEKVGLGVPAALTTLEGFTLFGEPFDPLSLAQREVLLGYLYFVERHNLGHLTHIEDPDGTLWDYFGVSSQPSWIFFAANGEVVRGRGVLPSELFKSE